ncbi:MAG: hypothetical protein DLM69_11940 [Candidatus Chloroheliales bacterium]|nr:MAG: hypothetical protein DLM69_11940 [Chloroflexota bacterium]
MLGSQTEYEFTKEWVKKFERKLGAPRPEDDPIDPRARKIERDAIASTLEELREELAEYEAEHHLNLVREVSITK